MSGCIAGVVDMTWPLILLSLVLNAASSHEQYVNKHNEIMDVQSMVVVSIGIIA